jgi:poly-gamma-glutamate synthesis protein (capsule biosynthesis protein)
MDDTSRTLDAAGIKHFGMGHTLEEARRPVISQVGGLSFAFLGYNGISDDWDGATASSAGTSPMIEQYVREDVGRLAAAGHIVIPFFHWGTEYVALPTDEQRHFARVAIEAGAAIVMGSHPHWVQAVETYQGRPIVYSLGNFVFDQAWSRETTEGFIADIWFEGSKVTGIDYRPILIVEEHRPVLLDRDNAYHVLERIWTASEEVRSWG